MIQRFVVIMAGGAGKRFWPLSRRARPKQLLALVDPTRSLLRRTFDRVVSMTPADHVLVVTGSAFEADVRRDLPEIPAENILVEPIGRNTAPCIAWATAVIAGRHLDAAIAVLPSDHHIRDETSFRAHLELAFRSIESGPGGASPIALLGIVPTHAETGYGYIRAGGSGVIRAVEAFVEKPDRKTAESYLMSGQYLWNAGLFVFRAERMQSELAAQLPELERSVRSMMREGVSREVFASLPSISIDYGVMEKAGGLIVLPSSFGWSDVGSFDAIYAEHAKDESENVALGDALIVGASGSLVDARAGRVVAVVGASDLIVVDTKDAVLVTRRGHSQDVQKAVALLEEAGRTELL